MRRATIAILMIVVLLATEVFGGLAIVYGAGGSVASCSEGAYNAWEDAGINGGDGLHVCYPVNLPNLYNTIHTQAGWCSAVFQDGHDDWNDCISRIENIGGSGTHRVCIYTGASYTGSRGIIYEYQNVNWLWPSTFADSISSIKWDC